MTASNQYDIEIQEGATFSLELTWYDDDSGETPVDITDYTARMQIREFKDSVEPLMTLSNEGEGAQITLGGVAGTIAIVISAEATESLNDGVYDLELTAPETGIVTRLIQGKVIYSPQVTQDEEEEE